jgi:hypothetical protein
MRHFQSASEQLNVTPLKIFGIDMEKHRDADQRWICLTQTPETCVTNALSRRARSTI